MAITDLNKEDMEMMREYLGEDHEQNPEVSEQNPTPPTHDGNFAASENIVSTKENAVDPDSVNNETYDSTTEEIERQLSKESKEENTNKMVLTQNDEQLLQDFLSKVKNNDAEAVLKSQMSMSQLLKEDPPLAHALYAAGCNKGIITRATPIQDPMEVAEQISKMHELFAGNILGAVLEDSMDDKNNNNNNNNTSNSPNASGGLQPSANSQSPSAASAASAASAPSQSPSAGGNTQDNARNRRQTPPGINLPLPSIPPFLGKAAESLRNANVQMRKSQYEKAMELYETQRDPESEKKFFSSAYKYSKALLRNKDVGNAEKVVNDLKKRSENLVDPDNKEWIQKLIEKMIEMLNKVMSVVTRQGSSQGPAMNQA